MDKLTLLSNHYELDSPDKVTVRFMAEKLKEAGVTAVGNKEELTDRLVEHLGLADYEPPKVEVKEEPKEEPIKESKGLPKTAGFYEVYEARKIVDPLAEGPRYDWNDARKVKTLSMPHDIVKQLNIQKENSGVEYRLIK